jgi:autotransporter-associated beta strand protein
MKCSCLSRVFAQVVVGLVFVSHLQAATHDWTSATLGGNYSVSANWTPSSPTGGPGSADVATLGDATANRIVVVDSAAANTLGTLVMNQTSAFSNTLNVTKAFTITNAVTLGAATGTEEIRISPPGTSGITLAMPGGLTLNSGGLLSLRFGTSSAGAPTLSGNVTVGGGTIDTVASVTGTANQSTITGTLTMSSGSIIMTGGSSLDPRLNVNGNLTSTGGSISSVGSIGQLVLGGGTNSLTNTTVGTTTISLAAGGNQALSSNGEIGGVIARTSGTKTVSLTGSSKLMGQIQLGSSNTNSTTFRMGSDLTLRSGAGLPTASFGSGTMAFGIDTDGKTLDLTANTSSWTPNNLGTSNWTLSSTTGTGTIRANTFTFSTANQVNVGAGVTLESTNTASGSVLSGGGTISPSSTYRWSGGVTSGAIHTLTSTRTVGNLEVKTGILSLSSGITIDPTSTVTVGNSASTEQNTVVRFTGSGTYSNAFDLSKSPQLITTSTTGSPRNRIELSGAGLTLNLSGAITIGQTGSVANIPTSGSNTQNRRAEFNAVDASSTLNITGLISQNTGGTAGSFGGININGSNGGTGTVRLANTGNSFTAGMTVTGGTLVIGGDAPSGSVGVLGNSTSSINIGDGATPVASTVTVVTDGAFTVGRSFNLANGAGGAAINSYVMGSTFAGSSTFSGAITSSSSTTHKALTLTQVAGGTSTFSGLVSANPDATGLTSLTKTGLGTVQLTRAAGNSYDGDTTVSAGTLIISNTSGSATGTGSVSVASGATLGGSGTISPSGSGAITVAGNVAPGTPGVNNDVGTLTLSPASGNASFTSTATLDFELSTNGLHGYSVTYNLDGTLDNISGIYTAGGNDMLVFNGGALGNSLDFTNLAAGSINVMLGSGYVAMMNDLFDLFDWVNLSGTGTLNNQGSAIAGLSESQLNLPTLSGGLSWDTTKFTTFGVIAVVPEPSRLVFLALGLGVLCLRRRRGSSSLAASARD